MAIMVTPVYCRELIKILELCTEWRVECTIPKYLELALRMDPRKWTNALAVVRMDTLSGCLLLKLFSPKHTTQHTTLVPTPQIILHLKVRW